MWSNRLILSWNRFSFLYNVFPPALYTWFVWAKWKELGLRVTQQRTLEHRVAGFTKPSGVPCSLSKRAASLFGELRDVYEKDCWSQISLWIAVADSASACLVAHCRSFVSCPKRMFFAAATLTVRWLCENVALADIPKQNLRFIFSSWLFDFRLRWRRAILGA